MPGGRGTLLDIAASLNNENHTETAKAVKMAIDQNSYDIVGATVVMMGAAFNSCDHVDDLQDIWCHALEKGAVDWGY